MKHSLFAITILMLLSVACAPTKPKKIPMTSGHRGANCIAPENTMASADSCVKYGIEFMECDVCISKDSVFYILHDNTLDRTTNGEGKISQWLSADIDRLDAGVWFGPEFAGLRVPRLQELLHFAKANNLNLTLDYRSGDLNKLLDLVKSEGMLERCNFTFASDSVTKAFRNIAPEVNSLQAYIRTEADIDHVMAEYQPNVSVTRLSNLNKKFVKKLRARNLTVLALVLGLDDKTEAYKQAVKLGVDVVATDRPEVFVKKYGNGTKK